MHTDPVGRVDAGGLAVEVRAGREDLARHDTVGDRAHRPVHVGQEPLEDPDPLADAGLDRGPLRRRKDPGDDVDGERPLLAGQVEGDAPVQERGREGVRARAQVVGRHDAHGAVHRESGGPDAAVGGDHLVPGGSGGGLGGVPVEDTRRSLDLALLHDQTLVLGLARARVPTRSRHRISTLVPR